VSVSLPPMASCGAPNTQKCVLPQDPSALVPAALKAYTQIENLHSSHAYVISFNPVSKKARIYPTSEKFGKVLVGDGDCE